MHPVPPAGEVYHQVGGRFGSRLAADEVVRRFRRAFRESEQGHLTQPEGARLVTSEARECQRWRQIVAGVLDDVQDVAGCFRELFAHFALAASWRCFDEVPQVLSELQARGYQVAIASNFDSRLHAICDGIAALRDVKLRIISSEVGCRKPGRGFFDALVARAGCRPDEVLMVGDDPDNDIAGARQGGLSAVLINRRTPPAPGEIGNLRELIALLEKCNAKLLANKDGWAIDAHG
jgi:putative hydrolase of the HAD superfamily